MHYRIFNRVVMGVLALSLAACGSDLSVGDPVADAGEDQTVDFNTVVVFDSSGSSDEDGTIESFVWSEDGVELSVLPSFSYESFSKGIHTITLTVTDNDGLTDTDTVEITVLNKKPQAGVAEEALEAKTYETIELDGSSSFDSDGDIVSYVWRVFDPDTNETRTLGSDEVFTLDTNELGVGEHTLTLTVTDNDGATDSEAFSLTIALGNIPPVAAAGEDQEVFFATAVSLTGSGSDEDGSIEEYSWDEGAVNYGTEASVILPANLAIGTHTIVLTVTDNGDKTGTDELEIVVNNNLPLAVATATLEGGAILGESIIAGEQITFSGSDSSDVEGSLSYSWLDSHNGELGVELNAVETFDTDDLSVGTHAVTLAVTDENTETVNADIINFTVEENQAPVAVAKVNNGGSAEVFFGEEVTLDASESSDDAGRIDSYAWSGIHVGSGVITDYESGASIEIDDLVQGEHTITLTVTDNLEQTASAEVSVKVKNNPPVANAGADQAVKRNDSVSLNGNGSTDVEGTELLTYSWVSDIDGPLGTDIALNLEAGSLALGAHTITLTVTDGDSATASDEVTITVAENQAPVANAGDDQTVVEGSEVNFDGSGSADADGTIDSYIWTTEDDTEIATTATFSKNDFTVGTHTITLTVTDDNGATHSADVTITLTSAVVSRLNDTGIDFSGDAEEGNDADCVTGATVGEQDCSHGRDVTENDDSNGHAGFSFVKIDSDGNALTAEAEEWTCVEDTVSGLIWEVKTNDGTLRDRDWEYVNNSNLSGVEPVDAGPAICGPLVDGEDITCDTVAYEAAVNAEGLCGANDWRVPTIRELLNLLNYGRIAPSIDVDYFPNTLSDAVWSSSPAYNGAAWAVDFRAGNNGRDPRSDDMAVRLVRDAP